MLVVLLQVTDFTMKMINQIDAKSGFSAKQETTQLVDAKGRKVESPKTRQSTITWHPPCLAM